MDNKKIVLLVDNNKIGDNIEKSFFKSGFDVLRTNDPYQVVTMLKNESPNAMVIDWDLADQILKKINQLIREKYRNTGMVLLHKNRKIDERIHALEDGADDCLLQPAEVDELIAKVEALIRRTNWAENTPRILKIKDVEINLDVHLVKKAGKIIDLTYTQFKLLYLLASKREYIFSRDEILEKVWGENAYVTNRTVDVHVKRLREKLGEQDHPSKYIHTIHGLGYKFT